MQLVAVLLIALSAYCLDSIQADPIRSRRSEEFKCPAEELISPCRCYLYSKVVICNDVISFDRLRKSLANKFSGVIPSLKLNDVPVFALPRHAFTNISTKRLYLRGSNIRSVHDEAFEGQKDLRLLVLSEARLDDVPTKALRLLPDLVMLNLDGNFLTHLDGNSFSGLNKLKFLDVSDNRIFPVDRNAFPRSLEQLVISRNFLTSLNGSLIDLGSLGWLQANDNRLTSITGELDDLVNLEILKLSNNKITELGKGLKNLKKLVVLDLSKNNLNEIGDALSPLESLQELYLADNDIMEVDVDTFKNLEQLKRLDLSRNMLDSLSPVFTTNRNLQYLNLSNNDLNHLDFECFKGLSNLQELDLSMNELVNLDGVSGYYLPQVTSLYLEKNKIIALHHGLASMKDLRDLDVSDNSLVELKSVQIMHNKNLKNLNIADNPFTCTDDLIHVLHNLEIRVVKIKGKPCCDQYENAI